MKKSNVYTRTGDGGTTSLVGGVRVPKDHIRIEAYGTVDELNAHLGLLAAMMPEGIHRERVECVQSDLFTLGAVLATEEESGRHVTSPLGEADVERLERAIDETEEGLPAWRGFILPGGSPAAAQCHVCRTVCRRAERRIHTLYATVEADRLVVAYMNRLSDYLFVLARKLNFMAAVDEIIWRKC
ncbi:MAG: cob(I)yrinic acid a,c-diamide adenosyltransferase [Paraprevotella sp.]|nr:cob(I)yrinic acid a,c-diamide adenosyltransferase [Paraprevotella sp.]